MKLDAAEADRLLDWAREFEARACVRIGQLSREMEKVTTIGAGKVGIPSSGKPKAGALAEAGISTSTAQRYVARDTAQ